MGHAYEADGHVLFHVPSDPEYGTLSRRSLEDMVDGARVEVAPYKRDPKDFVLWKPSTGELAWLGEPLGSRSPRLAHRVLRHDRKTPGDRDRHSRRRFRPHLPPSRKRSRTESLRTREPRVRALLAAQRHADHGLRKRCPSPSAMWSPFAICAKSTPGEVLRFALLSAQYRSSARLVRRSVETAQGKSRPSLRRAGRCG